MFENYEPAETSAPLLSWSAEAGQLRTPPEDIGDTYEQWKLLVGAEPVIEDFLHAEILACLDDLREGQVLDVVSRSEPVSYPEFAEDQLDIEMRAADPVEQTVRITRTKAGLVGEFWNMQSQEQVGESFGLEQARGCDRRAPMLGQAVLREGEYLAATVQFADLEPYDRWLFGPIRECCVIDYDDPRLAH